MQGIFRSFFTVSFYTLISRILGFVRDILIARFLGSTVTSDAFFVAFRIPNFFRRVLAEGAYSAALIPVFSGIVIGFAIALHNIPEGMSISVPIYHATGSKRKAILYTALSGVTEPLGALFCYFLILQNGLNPYVEACIMSIVSGIMVFISLFVLLPMSIEYNKKYQHVSGVLVGSLVIGVSIYMLNNL